MRRLYGLFLRKAGEKRWTDVAPNLHLQIDSARRCFQGCLITQSIGGEVVKGELELRPVKVSPPLSVDAMVGDAVRVLPGFRKGDDLGVRDIDEAAAVEKEEQS